MNSFACHQASTDHEESSNGMKLKRCVSQEYSARNIFQDPPLGNPIANERDDRERCGYGSALEIFALPRRVFWQRLNRDVEACKPSKPAKYEESQQNVIDGGAHTNCEGSSSW
jgi:hypothetical protein